MDLFSDSNDVQTLRDRFIPILGAWASVLNTNTLERLKTTLSLISKDSENNIVYPDRKDILKLFREISPNNIRVVVIGQDPFHNGNANGYSFGCKLNVTPSLKQIIDSMKKSVPTTNIKKDIGLQYLANQGVFLLNTILSVRAGNPLSHNNLGWQSFTTDVVKYIQSQPNIVWLLWGSKAKEYEKYIINPTNFIIEDTHPVSASYNNKDWNSKCFVECNNILKEKNLKEIVWL
ncbi:MAG: uracil-DNA glycosylase [Bdellovibrionales bacterium]|nr:uracil-DNA glycosylase [Bdellovibrionales bacterium]